MYFWAATPSIARCLSLNPIISFWRIVSFISFGPLTLIRGQRKGSALWRSHTFLLPISTLFNREDGLPVNAQQEKYKALIWLRKWESNPLLLAYETSEIPYLPSAINWSLESESNTRLSGPKPDDIPLAYPELFWWRMRESNSRFLRARQMC